MAPPPPEILEILRGASPALRRAREQLKQYNNAFAFVSYGADCFKDMPAARGPPVTICHGTVYHSSGFLFPDETALAKYAQVYLYDANEALEARRENAFNQGLAADQLQSLQDMMDRVSPYAKLYRSMRDVVETQQPTHTKLAIAATPGADMRRYNKPNQYEPAMVFASPDGQPPTNRDIAVWHKKCCVIQFLAAWYRFFCV